MHVDVVFAPYPLEYPDIFGVTDLDDERTTPLLDVAFENRVAILCHPNDVCC